MRWSPSGAMAKCVKVRGLGRGEGLTETVQAGYGGALGLDSPLQGWHGLHDSPELGLGSCDVLSPLGYP